MSVLVHTASGSTNIFFTNHVGVSFKNLATNEVASSVTSITTSPSVDISYDVTWAVDPKNGESIELTYDGTGTYADSDGVLMIAHTVIVQSCAVPKPIVNMLFNTGQSNSDESQPGDVKQLMIEEGIVNPVYSENPFPGEPYRNWHSTAGFKKFMDGTEDVKTVTSVDTSFPRAVFTSTAHGYNPTNNVVLTFDDFPQYNGFYRVFNRTTDTFEITEETLQGLNLTGNVTVKRAGCIEKWQEAIDEQLTLGNQVNIIGMMFMQGYGNSNQSGALPIEWQSGRYFGIQLKALFESYAGLENVTIDPGFAISFGLTSNHGPANDKPQALFEVRRYQRDACKFQDFMYWVDSTIDQRIVDGVHIADMKPFHRRQIRSILDKENQRAPNPQFGV